MKMCQYSDDRESLFCGTLSWDTHGVAEPSCWSSVKCYNIMLYIKYYMVQRVTVLNLNPNTQKNLSSLYRWVLRLLAYENFLQSVQR